MLLTEQEVDALRKSLPAVCKHQDVIRAAESAVLEKLNAQEPACFVGRIEYGAMLLMSMPDDWVAIPLYEHPLPPDDVVRDAHRVAELEAVLRECREALDGLYLPGELARVNSAIAKIDEVLNAGN